MEGWNAWGHFEASGLELRWHPLPYINGAYVKRLGLIILDPRRSDNMLEQVLTHELGHHAHGHEAVIDPQQAARQELEAVRWAAIRLITFEDLLEAVTWTPWFSEVAEILDVDSDLLSARVDLLSEDEKRLLEEVVNT